MFDTYGKGFIKTAKVKTTYSQIIWTNFKPVRAIYGVIVIIIRNGLVDPSSNPGLGSVSLHTNTLRKGINSSLTLIMHK